MTKKDDEIVKRVVSEEEEEVDKLTQRKARLAKLRLAAIGGPKFPSTPDARRDVIQKTKSPTATIEGSEKQDQLRIKQEVDFINKGKPIRPKGLGKRFSPDLKKRMAQEEKIAQEHKHSIVFRSHERGQYRAASLSQQGGKYAKYWLLNAKQVNGNGWGIAQHTARENMKKFIGRPLVVTSAQWHGASEYGNRYEHPYLPTNDLNRIFQHQEKFRVGSIVGIDESPSGDFHAVIEMNPKFAHMTLPPFCSPAIFQLDAMEHEGNISKWEALHLAALDENPAYGAKIAILKGTCVGTEHSCTVQFKSAKLKETSVVCPTKVANIKSKLAAITAFGKPKPVTNDELSKLNEKIKSFNQRGVHENTEDEKKKTKIAVIDTDRKLQEKTNQYLINKKTDRKTGGRIEGQTKKQSDTETKALDKTLQTRKPLNPKMFPEGDKINSSLKRRLAKLKTAKSVEDILRGKGRSVDASHDGSTFLSRKGDFIGGGESHDIQARSTGHKSIEDLQEQHGMARVQNFRINRAGEERTSIGIIGKMNSNQISAIKDLEKAGKDVGWVVGKDGTPDQITGRGVRDLIRILGRRGLL